jgi:signal transduction histidine kinase
LRTKLFSVLLIPTVAAGVLGGMRVYNDLSTATDLGQLAQQVQLQSSVYDVVYALQRERDLTIQMIAIRQKSNRTDSVPGELAEQRGTVTHAVQAFQGGFDRHRLELAPDSSSRFAESITQLEKLDGIRRSADDPNRTLAVTEADYHESVQSLLDLGAGAIATIKQSELVRVQLASNALSRAQEQLSRKREILHAVIEQGKITPDQQRALLVADATQLAALGEFTKAATLEQRNHYNDTVTGSSAADTAGGIVQDVITRSTGSQSLNLPSATEWDTAVTRSIDQVHDVVNSLQAELKRSSTELSDAARTAALTDSVLVLGALVLTIWAMWLVARSLLRPLRSLRRAALAIADHQLPEVVERILADSDPQHAAAHITVEAVPVHSLDEVGQVARSFDAVHYEAVRLASQQAMLRDNVNAMFVNLSRRSQALVERQLALIDRLEQEERDPDQLSNLFELDHLATRMRRNSENLLVLSGTDLSRRMTKPVPVADVIGAAVSEVEQYARIQLAPAPKLMILGLAVNDLVHLIAELLDNATAYSAPDSKVTVHSSRTKDGALVIEIADRGVGMSENEIRDINLRLLNPPEVDVAVSRRMGLYVVARLARRHDVEVSLRANRDQHGGMTALVLIPSTLVTEPGEEPVTRHTNGKGLPAVVTTNGRGIPPVPNTNGHNVFGAALAEEAGALPAVAATGPQPPASAAAAIGAAFSSAKLRRDPQRIKEPAELPPEISQPSRVSYDEAEILPAPPEPVPVPRAPVARRRPAVASSASAEGRADGDAPTQRLPLYEAVLSQWFHGEAASEDTSAVPAAAVNGHAPEWDSPADAGWQRAQALLETPVGAKTRAGLPQRVRGAQLMPGSADSGVTQKPARPARSRSADDVRGRMSSFQQGVRRGRHEGPPAYPDGQPGPNDSQQQDEEQG